MATYAKDTAVSVERSRAEIERTLARWGATAFAYGWQGDQAVIQFAAQGRQVRFDLPLPARDERRFTHTPTGLQRSECAAAKEWEQGVRQRWRALVLAIKAKLEAVESGISEFEDEFAAWILLPDGQRVRDHIRPAIARAYEEGAVGPLLALGPGQG